ncbi:MAG: hypothetical protein A2189_01260, partial [Paenibacillus sp. RIFOXYA1_FULL_44_5]
MHNGKNHRWLSIAFVLAGTSCYGMLSPLVKLAYLDGWSVNQVSASQMLLGALMFWGIVLLRPRTWSNPFKGPWIRLILAGSLGLSASTLLINTALNHLDASFAIILLFQFTWMTMVLEFIFYRRRPTRMQILSAIMVMAGTLTALGLSDGHHQLDWIGIISGLASGLTYSIFLLLTGNIEGNLHPITKTAVMLTAAVPVFVWVYPPGEIFSSAGSGLLLWGMLLGLLGQVIPTLLLNIGIPQIGSSLSALL